MHKINLPLGTRAEFGERASRKQVLVNELQKSLEKRSFMKVNTPLLEYKEVFANFDLKQMRTYQLLDRNNKTVVLRPDLTLPIARLLTTTNIKLPQKLYYVGDLFKIAKELSGRNNQMTQAGIELVGYSSSKAELECLLLINRISRKWLNGRVKIEISHACFAESLLTNITASTELKNRIKRELYRKRIPEYQRAIKQFENTSIYGFLQKWPRLFGEVADITKMLEGIKLPTQAYSALQETVKVAKWIAKIPGQKVIIDLSTAPPQRYYTGITFKGFVDDIPEYLFSGGRYDQLLESFQAQPEPAVGMGIDIDLLSEIAELENKKEDKNYLFFEPDQTEYVSEWLLKNGNYELSLEDDLETAKEKAYEKNAKLFKINKQGEIENVVKNSSN
ncbi:ATP phosphoribosyltransferase regulatory subunit [Liquorilactobacillus sucicola DSM 21376 = JCM 15457]|uniref:ATP phosphoribosyltransferase regulatory subunit n=1 Tax=Liquorilactobacillus sucicola DSM 21376 = JCM 15457 TaxID=1423806 RepID=A0A023D004_9LACO|nr:ATP phosphoribosyltransferase regulatory subunit [Liquorilactobacillus sucicola]KRN06415.1 atp phosphoribosyltransferase regulatory subunit [Liquorilactobacillus sucicola DSM 21376 = JCM 15457]GAJ27457.1 ATP phosphoribosyltransferase regulatory subunit [Liquorilactobacillus sucicola DSM 21376 = JCM 15457]